LFGELRLHILQRGVDSRCEVTGDVIGGHGVGNAAERANTNGMLFLEIYRQDKTCQATESDGGVSRTLVSSSEIVDSEVATLKSPISPFLAPAAFQACHACADPGLAPGPSKPLQCKRGTCQLLLPRSSRAATMPSPRSRNWMQIIGNWEAGWMDTLIVLRADRCSPRGR
jgi:hypothetical protein